MITTFERKRIEAERLCGTIVAQSKQLLLLHQVYDFIFDGYIVIRKRDITKSYIQDSAKYYERLMRKEKLWKNPSKQARSLLLTDFYSLLHTLDGKVVIVENERRGDFWIGSVVGGDPRGVIIHHFDACGE